ncbi:hypothetical protein [Natronorubrum daqingense]|uniref:hypothetical protein n=1 Tax=Natronorubrum daqingense TaxID=588898 RepID=UPI0026B921EC
MATVTVLQVSGESVLEATLVSVVALVHLLPRQVPFSVGIDRSTVRSAAGGVSLAYVFVHLFPELEGRRPTLEGIGGFATATQASYTAVFAGLALFYGLERLAALSRSHEFERDLGTITDEPVFWIHVGSFAVYNAFIGYVLVRGETGAESDVLFAIAMALHLFGNDEAMMTHHRESYVRYGRWILATAVLVGALVGAVERLSEETVTSSWRC